MNGLGTYSMNAASIRAPTVAYGFEFKVRWVNVVLCIFFHAHKPALVYEWRIKLLRFSPECGFGKKFELIEKIFKV